MSSPRASSHASAIWPGVRPFSSAISSTCGHELEVALEVLALEARVVAAEVALREIVRRPDLPGEEAAAERAVRDEADAELAAGRKHPVLRVARPQRVLGLERRDRVDGVRAADRLRRGLGQAEVAHLARLDELRHRADGLLDRHADVDAVLVVEVDVVDAEPLAARPRTPAARTRRRRGSRASRRRCGRCRTSSRAMTSSRRPAIAFPTSFSFAPRPYMSAVSRKSIPSSSARWIVAIASPSSVVAVELRHPHAAEAEGRDLEPLCSKSALCP